MTLDPQVWDIVPSAQVIWRRAIITADDPDNNNLANWRPVEGKRVTLRASITGILVYDPYGEDPVTVDLDDVVCRIDENGDLKTDGMPVYLAATDNPKMSVQGWHWYVVEHPEIRFPAPTNSVVDISRFVLAPAVDETKQWIDRIPDLLAAVEGIEVGPVGPANQLIIGDVSYGISPAAWITGEPPLQALNLVLPRGANGVGIESVTPYFFLAQEGDPYPTRPTVREPGPETGWMPSEPTYMEGTVLYRSDRIDYTDNEFSFTVPVISSAYMGAKQAEGAAKAAFDRAEEAVAEAIQAHQDALTAIDQANSAVVTADTAVSQINSAVAAADAAQSAAQTAQETADLAAADLLALAGRTGRVIRSETEPTDPEDLNSNNLWLGGGKLYEYNGVEWVEITDPRLTTAIDTADQATNLANAAQQQADNAEALAQAAQTLAGTAQADAAGAQSTADAAATAASTAQAAADAAAADAIAKADAAEAAAKAHADAVAEAERLAAIAAASQDASDKAAAAEAAAIEAAAADALVKANQAEAAAKLVANAAQADATQALADAAAAQSTANTAVTSADNAQAAALAAQSTASSAAASASTAQAAAQAAQGDANQALLDAAAAAGIADGKSDVLIQPTEPTVAMRKQTTLWIDESDGNHPKRWDSQAQAWVVVTDQTAIDAASAAVAAQNTANQAVQDASAADAAADAAMAAALLAQDKADTADAKATTADGRFTVGSVNPTDADAYGKPLNAVWEVKSGSTLLRRYVKTSHTSPSWSQVKMGQDFIGEDAIGTAQIGDLAVGTAQIADLAVTDAKVGSMSVGKLTADQSEFQAAVIDVLMGQEAFLNNLYANRVIVSADNLVRDPGFVDPIVNAYRIANSTGTWTIQNDSDSTDQINSKMAVSHANLNSATPFRWRLSNYGPVPGFEVKPGEIVTMSVRCRRRGSSASSDIRLLAFFDDDAGYVASRASSYTTLTSAAPNWVTITWQCVVPDKSAWMRCTVDGVQNHTELQFSKPIVRRAIDGELIVEGAITGKHITADQAFFDELAANVAKMNSAFINKLSASIIATSSFVGYEIEGAKFFTPSKTALPRIEIEGSTIKVLRNAGDGEAVETLSIGGTTADIIALRDSAGKPKVSFSGASGTGTVAGRMTVGDLTIGGKTFADIMEARPKGIVSRYHAYSDSAKAGSSEIGLIRFRYEAENMRQYKLHWFGLAQGGNPDDMMRFMVRYRTDGGDATVGSTLHDIIDIGKTNGSFEGISASTLLPAPASQRTISVLLTMKNNTANRPLWFYGRSSAHWGGWIEDIGGFGDINEAIETLGGGTAYESYTPPPPAKQTYTKTYPMSWWATYRNNAKYTYGDVLEHGYYSSIDRWSMVGFGGTLATDISGATIKSAKVHIDNAHFYYGDGGTMRAGSATNTSAPSGALASPGSYIDTAIPRYWDGLIPVGGFTTASRSVWFGINVPHTNEYYGKTYPAGTYLEVTYEK